jgi:hypothetical protein
MDLHTPMAILDRHATKPPPQRMAYWLLLALWGWAAQGRPLVFPVMHRLVLTTELQRSLPPGTNSSGRARGLPAWGSPQRAARGTWC